MEILCRLFDKSISLEELKIMASKMFDNLIKAVVDVERGLMVVDAGFHSDQECFLLEDGSEQGNLWGINLHPDRYGKENFIVYDSMINMRPGWGNRSRGIDDPEILERVKNIVMRLVVS